MSSGEAHPASSAPSRPRGILPHWDWESFEDRKQRRFPKLWVGDNTTIETRRIYMEAYVDWMLQGSGEYRQRVQKKAEEDAVNRFVQEGKTEVKNTLFEWAVDCIYWYSWFDPVYLIVGGHLPPYPWRRPEEDPNEPSSETFAEILAKRRNKEQENQRQQSGSADEPQSRQLEAPAEGRGTSSQSLDLISDMLAEMPVYDNGGLDSDMVAFLLPYLANPESRQRLRHFFEEADPDWHCCLESILNLGLGRSARDGGRRCRCSYHRNPRRLIMVKTIGDDEEPVLSFKVEYEGPSSEYNW
ncbi:hypothetical protein NCS52_01200500 [Fusarium sp. LHS14.1]|nr:hypothetical protein NCS52_01200500 [Fusarium sp. LHS14.1]